MNRSTMLAGAAMAPTLHVNASVLWKITLGFIPSLVNLHKRIAEEETPVATHTRPDEEQHEEDATATTWSGASDMLRSVYVNQDDNAPDAVSVSDISGNSSYSSYASTGWSKADPILEMHQSIETSVKDDDDDDDECSIDVISWYSAAQSPPSVVTYSGSYYNFARTPQDNNRKKVPMLKEQSDDTPYDADTEERMVQRYCRIIPHSERSI